MDVGICWPSDGATAQPLFDVLVLDVLKESTGATHLRINLDHRRGVQECAMHVEHIRTTGWEVLPILDFDYKNPSVGSYSEFCEEIVKECGFETVELGNEPHTLHKMDPSRYADIFKAGAAGVGDSMMSTEILIACEPTKPPGERVDFFDKARRQVPVELYDGLAIHPYRNPMGPSFSRFGSRIAEAGYYRAQAPGKSIHVTEVGWDLKNGVNEQSQADYTYQELRTWKELGAESVYIYAFMDGGPGYKFGILDENRQPRPVAAAIKRFQTEQG
jgi:hypothetical protein